MTDPFCIHGQWENKVCVCNTGYETEFNELQVLPRYCDKELVIVISNNGWLGMKNSEIIHLAAMTVWTNYNNIIINCH